MNEEQIREIVREETTRTFDALVSEKFGRTPLQIKQYLIANIL